MTSIHLPTLLPRYTQSLISLTHFDTHIPTYILSLYLSLYRQVKHSTLWFNIIPTLSLSHNLFLSLSLSPSQSFTHFSSLPFSTSSRVTVVAAVAGGGVVAAIQLLFRLLRNKRVGLCIRQRLSVQRPSMPTTFEGKKSNRSTFGNKKSESDLKFAFGGVGQRFPRSRARFLKYTPDVLSHLIGKMHEESATTALIRLDRR